MNASIPVSITTEIDASNLFSMPPDDVKQFLAERGWNPEYSGGSGNQFGVYYTSHEIRFPILWTEAVAIEFVRFIRIGR